MWHGAIYWHTCIIFPTFSSFLQPVLWNLLFFRFMVYVLLIAYIQLYVKGFQGWLAGIWTTNWFPLTKGRFCWVLFCFQHSTVSCICFSRDEVLSIFPLSWSRIYWCGLGYMAAKYVCFCWSSFLFISTIPLSSDLYHSIITNSAVMLPVIYHFCPPSNHLSSCPLSSL